MGISNNVPIVVGGLLAAGISCYRRILQILLVVTLRKSVIAIGLVSTRSITVSAVQHYGYDLATTKLTNLRRI